MGTDHELTPAPYCIIPGGGLTKDGRWVSTKNKGKFLFSVIAMSKVFKARFIEELEAALPEYVPKELRSEFFGKNWVVYAKRPFESVHSAIEYLGRYTHKIAISNHRLVNITEGKVTFTYKDYKDEGREKEMTLEATEFIRRFALHILHKA